MAKVFFKTGTMANYAALGTPSDDTLYFITDVMKVYKGAEDYTASVRIVAAGAFPSSNQAQGILYVDTTNGVGKIWSGTAWVTVFSVISVINDLTTGGTTSALSAEQGKTLKTALDLKAPLANPTFTGTISLPSANPSAATQAAHKGYVDAQDTATLNAAKTYADGVTAANDAMVYKGTLGTGGTITVIPTTYNVGWTYRIITAGTYAGYACEIGDLLIAIIKRTGTGNVNADWTVGQTNIDGAVVGAASSTDDTLVLFSGTSGKLIKGSSVTITALNAAIANSHAHSNKTILDAYSLTQTELLAAADTAADSNLLAHADITGTTVVLGHLKLGTTSATAAAGNHTHSYGISDIASLQGVLDGKATKVVSSVAGNFVNFADGTGGLNDSGISKTLSVAAIATASDSKLPTEKAVRTSIDEAITWGTV